MQSGEQTFERYVTHNQIIKNVMKIEVVYDYISSPGVPTQTCTITCVYMSNRLLFLTER